MLLQHNCLPVYHKPKIILLLLFESEVQAMLMLNARRRRTAVINKLPPR